MATGISSSHFSGSKSALYGARTYGGMARDAFDQQARGLHLQYGPPLAYLGDIRMGERMIPISCPSLNSRFTIGILVFRIDADDEKSGRHMVLAEDVQDLSV